MLLVISYIFANDFRCCLITNRAHEIAVFPEFTTPQMALEFREFSEENTCRDAFELAYNIGNGVSRWKGQKQMDMVICHLKSIYLNVMVLCNFVEQLLHSLPNIPSEYPLSILRGPDEMVLGIINCVTGSFECHADRLP